MKLRRIVVGNHPVSDPNMGPMDWTSSDAELGEVLLSYLDRGLVVGDEYTIEEREFQDYTPAGTGTLVAIEDFSEGFLWLWESGMDFGAVKALWDQGKLKEDPRSLPGRVTPVSYVGRDFVVAIENEWAVLVSAKVEVFDQKGVYSLQFLGPKFHDLVRGGINQSPE